MVVTRPPMGWNSWNTFGENINEKMIMEMADKMAEEKLPEYGYEYLVIDDCWSEKLRDANGKLVADHVKFPHGMKYVADYVHSKGLKFGMYSCAGSITCAGYPASYEHEFVDAATFAEWGVDFLKYDYCFHDMNIPGESNYRRMGMALANCGRDILFSACSWGADNTAEWIKTTGAHMWRSTGDINDSWGSVCYLANLQKPLFKTNGHGCFNDMDMLVVGMNGRGNVGVESGMSFNEYKSHFSLWCLYGSPLMLGCDVRNMTEETKKIIMNKDAIAIDQDPLGAQIFMPKTSTDNFIIACRMLDGGDIAIGAFNLGDTVSSFWSGTFTLAEIGLNRSTGKTLLMKELWSGEEYLVENEVAGFGGIEPHDCRFYRAKIVDARY